MRERRSASAPSARRSDSPAVRASFVETSRRSALNSARAVADGSVHWTISQLVPAGPEGPRKDMKIVVRQNGGAGSGEVEISHGAIEAEQLFDPERA
jgi:hypothetical protein